MENYYLGLDMGTGSVGWAVTDEEYHLGRAHGKDLWGVRLFESANTAEERRQFRCNRRRLDRRNERLRLLQELFAEDISKVDAGFFLRLKESRYVPEDKRDLEGKVPELPYALFVDKSYTDKTFHKEYPTIYHLRKELMESAEPKDVRLVYLAIHHIIKHRGHFLFSGLDENGVPDFAEAFHTFVSLVDTELELSFPDDDETVNQVRDILQDEKQTKSRKADNLIQQLHLQGKQEKALCKLLCGGKVKLSQIFGTEEYDTCEKPQISFAEASYEEYEAVVEETLGEHFALIAAAKAIYNWTVLVAILGEEHTISEAKVKLYEKHRRDLRYLKDVVRQNLPKEVYRKLFVSPGEKNNYAAYIGNTRINGKKTALENKLCTREAFYDFLKKEICCGLPEKDKEYIENELELGTFLPRQVSKDNGVIPYQLQQKELKAILKNAGEYLPCVRENQDKIEKILTFRIPYYVGPLGNRSQNENELAAKEFASNSFAANSFAWAVRNPGKEHEKIYPWNFSEIIDEEASAEGFIRRMTNKCTYLAGEDVLPKESLLYSKFTVLNELNNLRINDEKISVDLKQKIYEELFQNYRKVTQKRLRTYLEKEGIIDKEAKISGIDGDFKASLRSYHDFKEKLTGVNLSEKEKENIILNVTLFGEDEKLLKKRLKKQYPMLTEKQLSGIGKLRYKGWGRLSGRFLEGLTAPDQETGEAVSIIRMLWETNENLMQLLSSRYGYVQAIEAANGVEPAGKLTYETVDKLYVSPAVKRQIWQTLQIVEELKKVMNAAPKRVFLEVAREKADSGRTVSRKKLLSDLYRKCREEEHDWINEIENTDEHSFKSDRLFLYYTQKGKCMYCGKSIDPASLWTKEAYDIDHIYPQSRVMDDSIRNRVLTCRTCNAKKEDRYPLDTQIREKMQPFWHGLLKENFIEEEKYKRLVRKESFSADELAGFIERQLVETRQSTKAVADILKRGLPDTEIVYVKAKTVSAFRQDYDLIKVRELNDYHHAQDAYLNIVVGNTYYVKFTKDAKRYISAHSEKSYNLNKMFERDVVSGGETAWKSGEAGSIVTVKKTMRKNSILFTRRSYEKQGGLFDQQLMKKGKGQIPVKGSDERLRDIGKYGGYNKAAVAYFMLVESEGKKGARKKTLETIPIYRKRELEGSAEKLKAYLETECKLKQPKVLIPKIKIDSLFSVNGFKMHLSGRSVDRLTFKGANQLLLAPGQQADLKKVVKVTEQLKENKNYKVNEYDGVSSDMLLDLYDVFYRKLCETVYREKLGAQIKTLEEGKEKFLQLSIEEKCQVLYEILHLFQCRSVTADLSKVVGDKHKQVGTLKMSKTISGCQSIYLIYQSPSGIYEQEIDLNKL